MILQVISVCCGDSFCSMVVLLGSVVFFVCKVASANRVPFEGFVQVLAWLCRVLEGLIDHPPPPPELEFRVDRVGVGGFRV